MRNIDQLELGFENRPFQPVPMPQQTRMSRAQWWFKQMRAVVDMAIEWKPQPQGRPEQICMLLSPKRS